MKEIILTIYCPDTKGIVYKVSEVLYKINTLILDSNHHSDRQSNQFFMRLHLLFDQPITNEQLLKHFHNVKKEFSLQINAHEVGKKTRALILCSKESHCLIDLISRVYRESLDLSIEAVISNHNDLKHVASWQKIPFLHLPITSETKRSQERQIEEIIDQKDIELVILARYMQILSPEFCEKLKGRCINIHHSFLPSFKGANPYQQAFDRGVKMIGATSHFVTDDLDEGPILFQEAVSVSHKQSYLEFKEIGRGIETRVLASAVQSFTDKRIFLDGRKTVIL